MKSLSLCLAFVVVGTSAATARQRHVYSPEAEKDLVETLPGLTFTPEFQTYSGYINVAKEGKPARMMHYIFSESSKDPGDPVVIWSNGGKHLMCSGEAAIYRLKLTSLSWTSRSWVLRNPRLGNRARTLPSYGRWIIRG